jgi:hypothetical protein
MQFPNTFIAKNDFKFVKDRTSKHVEYINLQNFYQ